MREKLKLDKSYFGVRKKGRGERAKFLYLARLRSELRGLSNRQNRIEELPRSTVRFEPRIGLSSYLLSRFQSPAPEHEALSSTDRGAVTNTPSRQHFMSNTNSVQGIDRVQEPQNLEERSLSPSHNIRNTHIRLQSPNTIRSEYINPYRSSPTRLAAHFKGL